MCRKWSVKATFDFGEEFMHALFVMSSPLAAASALSFDFTQNTPLQSVTLYLFLASTAAMGAGALFFFLMRTNVESAYRSSLVISGVICSIACFHYLKMTAIYQETGGEFPTALRYVDWLLTTPLILVQFPLLLRLGDRATRFFVQLVVFDVGMIVTAFIAETSPIGSQAWWGFFAAACFLELLIVAVIYLSLGAAIEAAPRPLARALQAMRQFILVGWAVYPIGFLMAFSGYGEVREIIYNIADVLNKVGFGLAAYQGVQALSYSAE